MFAAFRAEVAAARRDGDLYFASLLSAALSEVQVALSGLGHQALG